MFVFDYLEKTSQKVFAPRHVARMFHVSVACVRQWSDEGIFPCDEITAGGHRRFYRETVAAFGASRSLGL